MENFPQEERKGFVRDTMRKLSIHMPRSEASFQSKLAQYEIEIKDLQEALGLLNTILRVWYDTWRKLLATTRR
jgi:hypothetical protein